MLFSNLDCVELQRDEGGKEQTLCQENPGFTPDVTIGLGSSSVTFASTLTGTISLFGNTTYISKKISLNGRLYIDIPFLFQLCKLRMGPGAEIIVLQNQQLSAKSSDFFSCSGMWKGITALGSSKVNLSGCKVEDALNALSVEETTKIGLSGNTFNRNVVGLRNTNAGVGTGALQIDFLSGNKFTSTSPLNNGDIRSYAGIKLENCVADIGAFNSSTNLFEGMWHGIVADQCVLSVMSATFRDMYFDDETFTGGIGIYSTDGTLLVNGAYVPDWDLTFGASTFENCGDIGVACYGVNMEVTHANFVNNTTGIIGIENYYAENILITDNTFEHAVENSILGVGIERSIAAGVTPHNVVRDNNFKYYNTNGGAAISIGALFPAFDAAIIEHNDITVTPAFTSSGFTGISVNGGAADNFNIFDNDIIFECQFGDPKSRYGIYMNNAYGVNHRIDDNTILGETESSFPARAGIYIDNAKNVELCNNTMDYLSEGMKFYGDSDNATVSSNTFGRHDVGLLLFALPGAPTFIGQQFRRGNTWLTPEEYTYSDYAARNMSSFQTIELSKFWVETSDPAFLPPQRLPAGNTWFELQDGEKNHCVSESGSNVSAPTFTVKQLALLNGDASLQEEVSVASYWDMQRHLGLQGNRFPAVLTGGSPLPASNLQFFNTNSPAGYAQATAVDLGLLELPAALSPFEGQLSDLRARQLSGLKELQAMNAARGTVDADTEISDAFIASKQAVWQQLIALREAEVAIQEAIAEDYRQIADEIRNKPMMRTASGYVATHERAYATLQHFKLKRLLGTATAADWAEIRQLAEADPGTHGDAALEAGLFLPFCEDNEASQTQLRQVIVPGLEAENMLLSRVFPNPGSQSTVVQFSQPMTGTVDVHDINGRLVEHLSVLDATVVELDLRPLVPGLYIISINESNGRSVKQKLIVE